MMRALWRRGGDVWWCIGTAPLLAGCMLVSTRLSLVQAALVALLLVASYLMAWASGRNAGILGQRTEQASREERMRQQSARMVHEATKATLDGVVAAMRDRADDYELIEDSDGEPSAIAESCRIALHEQADCFAEMADEMELEEDA